MSSTFTYPEVRLGDVSVEMVKEKKVKNYVTYNFSLKLDFLVCNRYSIQMDRTGERVNRDPKKIKKDPS